MSAHIKGSFENKSGIFVELKNKTIDAAIRSLNRKVKQEGIIKEVRRRQWYEKPSVTRRRKMAEARRRAAKARATAED